MGTLAYAGGGWPKGKGEGYYKLSQWWVVSGAHFTDAGTTDPNVTSGIFNTSLYAEYGITDRLTGVLYFPFFSRAYMNNLVSGTTGDIIAPGDAINSIGDTDIGLKYGLNKGKKVALAATLTLGLPLGISEGGVAGNLQTGDGEFNQIVQMDAGYSFKVHPKVATYANAYVAYNNRTSGFSDEFRYGIEVGAGLFNQKWWLIGRLNGVESMQNGSLAGDINSTSIFANNTEFTSWSFETAVYATKKLGFSASYSSAFRGRLIFAAPAFSLGVFLDIK